MLMSVLQRHYSWVVLVPPPVVIGLLLALAQGSGVAQEEKTRIGRIVIPLDAQAAAAAEDADYKIERLIRKDARLAPAEIGSRALESMRYESGKTAQEAADSLVNGVAAYSDLNLEQAVVLFRSSASALGEGPASLKHSKEYVKALFYLGAALASSEQKDQAREAFQSAIAYDEKLEPDQSIFPPPVIEAFNEAKQALAAELRGSIKMSSTPAGARVWVNGRYAGVTPLHVRDLAPVEAIVWVEKVGHVPVVRRMKVTPSGEEELALNLVEIPEVLAALAPLQALRPGGLSENLTGHALDLGALTSAPLSLFVFVGSEGGGRVEAYLYQKDALVRFAAGPYPAAEASQRESPALGAVMGKVLAGGFAPSEKDRPVLARPFYKTWWFWTAAAGVAIATAAVLTITLWPEEQPAPQGGRLLITF